MEGRALVGRDRELDALEDALRCLRNGERAVVMLDGEPGIGKTRLLEELAAKMIAQGGVVAWGRTWEVGMTPAFWPFLQVLAALEVESDRAPLLGSLESRADAATRLTRFGEVAAFLSRRAAATPIAILLDDLHAADPSSLQLLEYVLPLSLRQRVLWALAARDSDAGKDIAAALGRIARAARRLPLARLDRGQVSALVGDRERRRARVRTQRGQPAVRGGAGGVGAEWRLAALAGAVERAHGHSRSAGRAARGEQRRAGRGCGRGPRLPRSGRRATCSASTSSGRGCSPRSGWRWSR